MYAFTVHKSHYPPGNHHASYLLRSIDNQSAGTSVPLAGGYDLETGHF